MIAINRNLRLPEKEYFSDTTEKTGIAIHHTVGGTARSTFEWWKQDKHMVGTAFIIGRNGTIYEVFDPECWAWQFGLNWTYEEKIKFEKRHIGIELASEGGIIESDGKYYCFDRISPKTEKNKDEIFEYDKTLCNGSSTNDKYRGYRYFDKFEDAQLDALANLCDYLLDTFAIPRKIPQNPYIYYGADLIDYKGIIGHAMVRKDKSDPAPYPKLWKKLNIVCDEPNTTISESKVLVTKFPEEKIEQLFKENVTELNKMDIPAGSMVKGLIMELERKGRDTYIKLFDAEKDGYSIKYEFIHGDKSLICKIATALGFKTCTDNKLEVYHA